MLGIAGSVGPVRPPAGHGAWAAPDLAGGVEGGRVPWPSWVLAEACWSPDLSPDGSVAVFVGNRSGLPRAWAQPVDGWAPARSLPTGTDHILDVSWSPDGEWIACLGTPSGAATRTRVWLVPAAGGGRAPRVAGIPAGTATFGPWLRSSAVLPLVTTGGRPSKTRASLLDIPSGATRPVAYGAPLIVVDLSHDGCRALVRCGPRGHRGLVAVDLATGRQQPLLVPDRPGDGCTEAGGFLPDGTIWACSDVGLPLAGLHALPPDGAPHVLAARPDAGLDTVAVTDDGRTAALVWNVLGHSEVELLDLASGGRTPVELLAEVAVVDRARFSRDGRRLVLAASGPALPRSLWLLDREPATSGRRGPESRQVAEGPRRAASLARRVDRSSAPLPRPDLLVRPTLERLPADDGLELTGWLYRPPTKAPHPTVLWLHGGPEAQTRPAFFSLHQALVNAGIAVFAPNVRGSSGFGRTFERADNGAQRFGAIRDVLACALHVLRSGVATPGRVGVMGHSYGGYLTLAALTFFPELFAVGVDVCGMSDLLTFFANTEPWVAAVAATKYGDPITDADLLAELSPLRRFDRLRSPLLVVHGAHDRNVPVSESEQAVNAARERGVPVDYLLFPDEGHEIERPANQLTFVDATLSWLTRHLRGLIRRAESSVSGGSPPGNRFQPTHESQSVIQNSIRLSG